jgi:hypothetical protein
VPFSVTSTGGRGTRSYQWYRDGTPVGPLVTSEDSPYTFDGFVLGAVTLADAGSYLAQVSDSRGINNSEAVALSVGEHLGAASISPEGPLTRTEGDSQAFEVQTTGGIPPLNYAWTFEAAGAKAQVPVGGNSPTLELTDLVLEDSGTYAVTVNDSGTDQVVAPGVLLLVEKGVPVGSLTGLAVLTGLASLLGASRLRRRVR